MHDMRLSKPAVARTGMLIRTPVEQVFEAIVNPEITSTFWFSKGSGRLEPGSRVRWDWVSHGVSIEVTARAVERDKRVLIEWPGYTGPALL